MASNTPLDDFERCWPWLEAALTQAAYVHDGIVYPTHDKLHVWQRIVTGRARLWAGDGAAIVTEFLDHPTGIRSHNNWLAGGDLEEIVAMVEKTEQWGLEHGCHRQVGNGRRGWLRKFSGYHEYGVRKQKDLLPAGSAPQFHQ